jgi:hypothetical protein
VRSEAENKFVGRPLGCIFVPWLDDPDWDPHPDEFIAAVKRFGCQTFSPILTRSNNSIISWLRNRIQPFEPGTPIVASSGAP